MEDKEIKKIKFILEKLESLQPVINEMDIEEYERVKKYIYSRMKILLA